METVTLEGRIVRLEPLTLEHVEPLAKIAVDQRLWEFAYGPKSPEEVQPYIERALRWQANGEALPFAIRHLETDEVIGSTRFYEFAPENRRIVIGYTWIRPDHWRTGVNTESKFLMLRYAFEDLGLVRVALIVNKANERSRRAVLRLGATEEGVLRSFSLLPDGTRRDIVIFSVLDTEWPAVRERLQGYLGES